MNLIEKEIAPVCETEANKETTVQEKYRLEPGYMESVFSAAKTYAQRGWAVFPLEGIDAEGECTCGRANCPDAGKHPLRGTNGFKEASKDMVQIAAWFGPEAPPSNVGIATGAGSNLTVIDVDIGDGKDGAQTWGALIAEHGEPETLMAQTGGGGMHVFFRYNAALKTASNIYQHDAGLGKGVDCRNDGGYVVAAPSRHRSGGVYAWLNELPVAALPAHLVPKRDGRGRGRPRKDDPTRRKYGLEEVRSMLACVPADDRDLWRSVGIILGREFNRADEAWELYVEWASRWDGKKGRGHDENMHECFYEISQQDAERELSISTIVFLAEKAGWDISGKPVVELRPGEIATAVMAIADGLVAKGIPYYRRNHMLVRAETLAEPTKQDGVARAAGSVTLRLATPARLRGDVSRAVALKRWDGRAQRPMPVDLPDTVGSTLIAQAPDLVQFPIVEGIACVPIMRADGSLLLRGGYDAATRVIFDPRGVDFSTMAVPERPTKDEAAAALQVLLEPLEEFNFVDDASRSVMLASMLGVLLRVALPCAPASGFSAPSYGAGKTLLANVVALLGTGVEAPAIALGEDEETNKTIDSVLLAGDPVALIDNISTTIGGDKICAATTSETTSIRLFHTQTRQSVANKSFWMLTGQNLQVRADMVRRSLIAEIDPDMEHPEQRSGFKIPDMKRWVAAQRLRLLAAAFTIMRAHILADPACDAKPLGSFEDWSRRVREPLLWLDQADPVARQSVAQDEDPVHQQIERVFADLFAVFGHGEWTVRDLAEKLNARDDLSHPESRLGEFRKHGDLDAKPLGLWLRNRAGRIAGGRKLIKAGTTDGYARWKLWPDARTTGSG